MRVALVHDYLTQRGGAERVVLSMTRAFPDAPLYTSVYEPSETFPEFGGVDVRTFPVQRFGPLRRHHRWGLPLWAPMFSRLTVDADVVLCSSSGWAHGISTTGRKVIYCYTPARWLYLSDQYLQNSPWLWKAGAAVMSGPLRRWDSRAAHTAVAITTSSAVVQQRIAQVWGREATIMPPPLSLCPDGVNQPVDGVTPGFLLVVCRLVSYKNVDAVIHAAAALGQRLVIVGDGPDRARLTDLAGRDAVFISGIDDAQLRWLYANCATLVAASHEDFGLALLEANLFGRPVAALRAGGFLDTVHEGVTGLFFDDHHPESIAQSIKELLHRGWDEGAIRAHAGQYSEDRFIDGLRALVATHADDAGGYTRSASQSATRPT